MVPCYITLKREIWHFHVVVVQKRLRNVQKKYAARAKLLFCLLNLLFFHVLVAVASLDLKVMLPNTVRFATTRFLAQHSLAMLEQCCNHSKQCRNNVATLCYAKNRRWQSINPPLFIFYHARSTDFEEKIEGL